ncbi:MAG: mismatch-specific glycosylase [Acidimicrobiaceae bacterium]|nr:mismatch-specific glycosylase [Acidimicrobiaceae bacterium]
MERPDAAALAAAAGRRVPDLARPGLSVLFCGINPGLYSAAVGHHFARPGNRFWRVLQASGFTEELLGPENEQQLLTLRLGITNLVERASATAAELSRAELRAGAARLEKTVRRLEPRVVAVLGMSAFRVGFERPRAGLGEQPERLAGARVWLLPNPSGAQAAYQLPALAEAFARLRRAAAVEVG